MTTAMLNELLDDMAPAQRESFRSDYQAVRQLPSSATDLQTFLDDYLQHVVRLYAATAGAIWFRSPGAVELSVRSRLGYDQLSLTEPHEAAHRRLLDYATRRPRTFLVQPYSAPAEGADVSNPTDSFLLLGPVEYQGERIGVLEIFLGPSPPRGQTAGERNRYVLWLDHLLEYLRQGIQLRFLGSSAPLQPALVNLASTRSEIEAFKDAIRKSVEITLNNFAGWNFGSLENNQTFTRAVHELLDANGLRVACPECGAAAILRCQLAGNSRTGVFLYDHYLETGRTFHGGPSTFPHVKLIAKPPRRKSKA